MKHLSSEEKEKYFGPANDVAKHVHDGNAKYAP